jgi:hypothetical protein
MRICSFDIKNMCTNIPKIDTTSVIINILKINSGINESDPKRNNTHTKNSNEIKLF